MMKAPEKDTAIIAQNANAYIEGIPEAKQKIFINTNSDRSDEKLKRLYDFTSADAVKHKQYHRDVKGREEIMSPDSWTHDSHFLESEIERKLQIELFQDYKSNLDSYPKWQAFLRARQYPVLLPWGGKRSCVHGIRSEGISKISSSCGTASVRCRSFSRGGKSGRNCTVNYTIYGKEHKQFLSGFRRSKCLLRRCVS